MSDLPGARQIIAAFRQCGRFAQDNTLRLTFHPDQFILLSSPHPTVTESSLAELDYQAEVAEWVNADVINIHGGGAYGDKPAALKRLRRVLEKLPDRVRKRPGTKTLTRNVQRVCATLKEPRRMREVDIAAGFYHML